MTLNEIPKTNLELENESTIKEQVDKLFKDALLQKGKKIGCKYCKYCKDGKGKGSIDCLKSQNIMKGFRDYFKQQHDITDKQELELLNIVFHCSKLPKIEKLWEM